MTNNFLTNTLSNLRISILAILALALAPCVPAQAQSVFQTLTVSGSLTASGSSCGATNCVLLNVISTAATAAVQVAGTYSGTLQFEGSVDGTNFNAIVAIPTGSVGGARVTSTTGTGAWQVNTSGFAAVRVRCSAYTSGTATVTIRRAQQPPLPSDS
ncbi:MAG: hypothetical protein KGL39_11455 [Patescibacteria group bacterium]|nr:hypothetical protein [Patescibacteria group bacterium]